MPLLAIERVEVDESCVEALVRVNDPALLKTSSVTGLASTAARLLPGLARHTCENDERRDALREFGDTETAHLLEHVAAELMALSGSPRSLRGETAWEFARDGHGVFRVRLEYDDDLVAIAAVREGAAIVEWLFAGEGGPPDIAAVVERLRAVRGQSARAGSAKRHPVPSAATVTSSAGVPTSASSAARHREGVVRGRF